MKHPNKCDGCVALWQSQVTFHCDLGYEIATRRDGKVVFKGGSDYIVTPYPKCGACPKPRTIHELFNAKKGWEEVKDEI